MAQSILIVDDEKDIVSMLNQYFYKIGYVVYTAINGKEALNAITKNPDIILLDINMPDMNGLLWNSQALNGTPPAACGHTPTV